MSNNLSDPIFPESMTTSGNPAGSNGGNGDTVTRILLICHAEGMHNRYENLFDSIQDEDSGLTALGWQQADKLANWLKVHEKIEVLVSGAQLHSRLTAQRIGQALGLPVSVSEDLPGRLGEDERLGESGEVAPDELDPEIHTSTHNAVLGPYVEFHHALISTLVQVLQEYRGRTIVLISSGSAIATILRHFFGAHQLRVQITHTGVSEIRHQRGQWYLQYVNRTEHIPKRPIVRDIDKLSDDNSYQDEDISLIAQTYNDVAQKMEEWYSGNEIGESTKRIEHLLNFAALPPGQRLLDVGSGFGLLALSAVARGASEAIGIDVSLSMLERAEFIRLSNAEKYARNVNFRLAPAQSMPFRNDRFDVVVCRLVLSHARTPALIMNEAIRVLKPGGIFLMADLLSDDDPVKRATQNAIESKRNPCHVAVRTKQQYHQLIADAGLAIESGSDATFERDLEEWLAEIQAEPESRVAVREMIEASLETDAAGMNVHRQGDRLLFDQHLYYLKAVKRDDD